MFGRGSAQTALRVERMAPPATQKTPDQAAALIQARVRGHQQRNQQRLVINAITKLQARQRGRYTRREFQKLLEFYNEQESFLRESKRRQLRLWHREQELYFLQHTTTEQQDAVRSLQHERSARRIQREWRRLHPAPLEDVDVGGLGRPFDPFDLDGERSHTIEIKNSPDRAAVLKQLYGALPTHVAAGNQHHAARRRGEIQQRLQRLCKEKDTRASQKGCSVSRRDLFNELVRLRQQTAQRLADAHAPLHRSQRQQRDLEAAQLRASCDNRIAFLLDDSRVSGLLSLTKRASVERVALERQAFEATTAHWSDERKRAAWDNHSRVVESVLGKSEWYETYVAGEKRDIRRVYAESPWEHDKQVWQWPRATSSTARTVESPFKLQAPLQSSTSQGAEVTAMERFAFCINDDDDGDNLREDQPEGRPAPLDDKMASAWWRAHATQSHASYRRLQEKQTRQYRTKFVGRNDTNNSSREDAQVTPEMLVNPLFYGLYKRTIEMKRHKELEAAVGASVGQLEHQIQQKVVEIETQIELNTRLIVEEKNLLLQQKARKTKEEQSATHIQRIARGKLGRGKAKEQLAQFFVLVRGRAIRKGKCEECGEQPAVLQCRECDESLHFCPVCWVQVHSTRRRKTHVPIPKVVEIAKPVGEPRRLVDSTVDHHKRTELSAHSESKRLRGGQPEREADTISAPRQPRLISTAALVLASPPPSVGRPHNAPTLDEQMPPPSEVAPAGSEAITATKETPQPQVAASVASEAVRSAAKQPAKNPTTSKPKVSGAGSRVSLPQRIAGGKNEPQSDSTRRMPSSSSAEDQSAVEPLPPSCTVDAAEFTEEEAPASASAPPVVEEPVAPATTERQPLNQHAAARRIQRLRKQRQTKPPEPRKEAEN